MPTQVWGEEWWKSNQYHDLMTSHVVAIAPPEPQIEMLQTSHIVVRELYVFELQINYSPHASQHMWHLMQFSHRKLYVIPGKKIATEHIWFSFFRIFWEGKFFETFKSHISSVLRISQLKPMAKYALSVVGLRALICSQAAIADKAAIVQDVTTCNCFPVPLLWSHVKTNDVHSGLIPALWFRVSVRCDDTSCRCLSQSLRDQCSHRSRAGRTGSLSSAELPRSPLKTLI